MKNKIGLFGGSFDPVHSAHLIIASVIKDEFDLEKVIFIPNYLSPFKTDSMTTGAIHRLEMLKLSLSGNEGFELSDYETTKNRAVYTYETLEYYKSIYPDKDFSLIIGYDSFKTLPNWMNYSFIEKNAEIIVALRPEHGNCINHNETAGRVQVSKFCPQMNISSTYIRQMIANKLSIKYLVNDNVQHYIMNNGLYLKT